MQPRVNSQTLPKHHEKLVRLVGYVVQQSLEDGVSIVQASDGVQVNVTNAFDQYGTAFVEILGFVNANTNSIEQQQYINWGDNFDLNNYNRCLQVWDTAPEIFH